jgi:hypothetical protein
MDGEQMQVFIAVLVVEKHDVAAVRAPSCQLIGRPLVRVTGWPAVTLSIGETQMFSD